MDLSNLQKAASNLSINDCNRKDEGNKNDSMKAPAKRLYFSPPTFRQNWSLPDSIIYYITMTPSSSKGYQKMIQSCKYFFNKNPIIVFSDLTFDTDDAAPNEDRKFVPQIEIEQDRKYAYIGLKNFSQKFWITESCYIMVDDVVKKGDILSNIIPHIYRCEATYVTLFNQIISFTEFMFFVKTLDSFYFINVIVKNDDDTVVRLEELVEVAVKVKAIVITVDEDADPIISAKTVENLLQIPHFASLNTFHLGGIPEAFDIDTFFAYIKENKHTKITLKFSSKISASYKEKIDGIIDEIRSAETREYKKPIITFR